MFCLLSKPINKTSHDDYKIFIEFTNKLSDIEDILNDNAKKIDIDNKYLVDLYLSANKELSKIWQLLIETL